MTTKKLLDLGGWVPINRELANALGNDAARVYAELLAFKELHKEGLDDGWFYLPLPKLAARCGLTRRPLERSLNLLISAELLITVTQGLGNLTHYKLAENVDGFGQISRTENVQKGRTVRTKKPHGTDNLATENVQISHTVCTKRPDYILDQEDKIEILEVNTTSEKNIARSRAASSSKKNEKNEELEKIAAACVENLNNLTGRKFEIKDHNTKLYKRLLVKGAIFEDIRLVHELKTVQWLNDAKMKIHLCPTTLTRECNFWGYLDMAKQALKDRSLVQPNDPAQMTIDQKNHLNFQASVAEMLERRAREGRL
jgi:uncharacterized phage protein (TIGR02220 family)